MKILNSLYNVRMGNKGSLTSLRFFAAYLVVGFHYFKFPYPLNFLDYVFVRGHLGVEFFFILSGFVMGLRYYREILQDKFDSSQFLINRMSRIAPAYYLSMVLSTVLLYRALGTSEFLSNKFNLSVFVGANLSFLQSYIPVFSLIENWNLPSWSLSVEVFFYLLFPIVSVRALKFNKTNLLLTSLFLLTFLLYTVHHLLPEFIDFMGIKTRILWINSAPLRLPQFLIGNLLAKIYLDGGLKLNNKILLYVSVPAALLVFIYPVTGQSAELIAPLSILIFSMLIYSCAACDTGKGFLNNKILILLGEASYVLYIFQVPLKVVFQQIYSKVLNLGETVGIGYCLYLSFTLIISSIVIHRYFELPANNILRKVFHRQRKTA